MKLNDNVFIHMTYLFLQTGFLFSAFYVDAIPHIGKGYLYENIYLLQLLSVTLYCICFHYISFHITSCSSLLTHFIPTSWFLVKWSQLLRHENDHFISSVSLHHRPLLHFLLLNVGGIWKCFPYHGDWEGLHYLRYDDGLWVAWLCTHPVVWAASVTIIERL